MTIHSSFGVLVADVTLPATGAVAMLSPPVSERFAKNEGSQGGAQSIRTMYGLCCQAIDPNHGC